MRIVGYYNSFVRKECIKDLELGGLTHINYAFLIPIEDGSVYFYDEANVKEVVAIAHKKRKKIFISVGGYCDKEVILNQVFEKICSNDKAFKKFINSIIDIVTKFRFDGVDLDWEYPTKPFESVFETMVLVLSKSMHDLNKEFTIAIHRAVVGEVKECRIEAITDKVIECVDWINIMTYDATEDRNHSDLSRCRKVVDYWHKVRNVPRDKILVGAAFYARPSEKLYYELISEDSHNYFRNSYKNDTYNGFYMIKEKLFFSWENCGGFIIWAINYDKIGSYSLLSAIKYLME